MTPFIQHVQNVADAPGRWPDEFLAWYKPDLWETENRAAAVFIGEKFAALLADMKGRHQRQHDAEALAGEYLMQRDDARAELERLRAQVAELGAFLRSRDATIVEQNKQLNQFRVMCAAQAEAAWAVVKRWDSPDWKDAKHTADYINALRQAITAAPAQQADLRDDVIESLRGDLAELQALCDERGRKLDELYTQQADHVADASKLVPSLTVGGGPVANVITTAPERIWLNLFDAPENTDGDKLFPSDHEGVTWAEDEVGDYDVQYVRADLAQPAAQAEPVAWQCRFVSEGADGWRKCSREHHELVQANPGVWPGYETRAVYADSCPPTARTQPGVWQPIETAPRDGSEVLLHEIYERLPVVGWWCEAKKRWFASTEVYDTDGDACVIDHLCTDGVTHWMPLPAAPSNPPAQGQEG